MSQTQIYEREEVKNNSYSMNGNVFLWCYDHMGDKHC